MRLRCPFVWLMLVKVAHKQACSLCELLLGVKLVFEGAVDVCTGFRSRDFAIFVQVKTLKELIRKNGRVCGRLTGCTEAPRPCYGQQEPSG